MRIDVWAWRDKRTISARCQVPGCVFHIQAGFNRDQKDGLNQAKISISCHMRKCHGMGRTSEWEFEKPTPRTLHCCANFAQPKKASR